MNLSNASVLTFLSRRRSVGGQISLILIVEKGGKGRGHLTL